jgi:hypothetical protein
MKSAGAAASALVGEWGRGKGGSKRKNMNRRK